MKNQKDVLKSNFKLITNKRLHSGDEKLVDHDININRLDALINSLIEYENDECPYNFLIDSAVKDIVKAKQMYLAWINEEY